MVLGKASDKQPRERKAAKSMKAIEESDAAKKSAKITEIPEPVQTVELKTSVSEESESREEQKGGKPSDRETSDAGSSEAEMGVDQQTSKENKMYSATLSVILLKTSRPSKFGFILTFY